MSHFIESQVVCLIPVFVLLPILATGSTVQQELPCTDSYAEFERASVGSNSSGFNTKNQLYTAFYPPNQHLPYSVLVTYQLVLANGTRFNLSIPSIPDLRQWTVDVGVFSCVPSRRQYLSQSPGSLHSQLLHKMGPTPYYNHHGNCPLSYHDERLFEWNDSCGGFEWHTVIDIIQHKCIYAYYTRTQNQ